MHVYSTKAKFAPVTHHVNNHDARRFIDGAVAAGLSSIRDGYLFGSVNYLL